MSDGQGGLPSYKDLENAVLDGTAAIHCLTHERDHLRGRVELQERELVTLRATNEDLRRQLVAIGESYMKFAASCINQLETIGHVMHGVENRDSPRQDRRAAL
jgi:hypothetical protein